jgi:hypothetical protein
LLPEAPFLLLYRDGRDVACSLCKVPWSSPDVYINFAYWLRFYRRHRWAVRQPALRLLPVKYEEFVSSPEKELRKIVSFLDLPYEPAMASGEGNHGGVPEREYGWKARAFEKITQTRVGVWRTTLSPQQICDLESWGDEALAALGYDLVTSPPRRLSWTFYPRFYWRQGAWRARCAMRDYLGIGSRWVGKSARSADE